MPVTAQGLDYSARRLSGRSIRDAGYDFVLRYLWFPGQQYPALNPTEMADLTANGVEVHGIYEQNTNDPAGGYAGGRRLAAQAVASATAATLAPGRTIFMCSDAWLSTHGIPVSTAMAFLDGARDIIDNSPYVLGAYGFRDFVYAAQDGGHADRFWLCGAESGVRDGIHLYQWNNGRAWVDGIECDLNKKYLPLLDGGSAGGRTGQGDPDMILVKGDGDAMYVVTSDVEDFAKRHINGLEAGLLEKAGVQTILLPQAQVDAIPNREDILAVRQQAELVGGQATLAGNQGALHEALSSVQTSILDAIAGLDCGASDPAALKQAVLDAMEEGALRVTVAIQGREVQN